MKPNPGPNEETLDRRLKEWRTDATLPPRFQEQVWRRIEQAGAPAGLWQALQAAIDRLVSRPRLALSYVTVALAFGLALGSWQARQDASALNSDLSQRYVQSVDPYHKPGHL